MKNTGRMTALMTALIMCLYFAGCGNTEKSAAAAVTESDVFLPKGYTMDDLKNMISIDGDTIPLPATADSIIEALGEHYSYDAFSIAEDQTPDEYFEEKSSCGVYIRKDNDTILFSMSLAKENYTGSIADSPIYNIGTLRKDDFEKCGLELKLLDKLTFDSNVADIIKVLGEPSTGSAGNNLRYVFYDDELELEITFRMEKDCYKVGKDGKKTTLVKERDNRIKGITIDKFF
ncbi:MAG: hypothetical protein II782_06730 [Oscillospiraceae bacterium]|nr:hypothetical protein [Oscillospiraceae bacterium]